MSLGQSILLLVMILIGAGNYLRYRDVLYPPVLQAAAWTAAVLLYILNQDQLYPLSPLFFVVVVAGMLLFSLGSYLATRGHEPARVAMPEVRFNPKRWFERFLVWGPVVGLPFFLYAAYRLGQDGPFDSIYRNIRLSRLLAEDPSAGGPFGMAAYLLPVSFASVLLQTLLGHYRENRRRYVLSVVVALTYAFFSTGRSPFILLLVAFTGVLLVTRRVSRGRTLLGAAAGGAVVFGWMGVLIGLAGSEGAGIGATLQNVVDLAVVYLLGPLSAFDQYLQMHLQETAWGANTFRTFYAVLSGLGFDVEVAPLVQEYVNVPFPTNVYTVYQPYFSDFGFAGIALAAVGTGCLHGFLYRRATRGDLFFVVIFALSLYPLLFQFYQDNYLSLLSLWVQYTAWTFLFFYRLRFLVPAWLPSTSSS